MERCSTRQPRCQRLLSFAGQVNLVSSSPGRGLAHRTSSNRRKWHARLPTPAIILASASTQSPVHAPATVPNSTRKPQPFDFAALIASAADICSLAVPSRIESAIQTSSSQLLLGLRTVDRGREWLVLDWHAVHGHIALSHTAPPQSFREDAAYSLSSLLRATAKGLAILKVAPAAAFERIARIDLGLRPGDAPVISIYLELFGGGRSNLVVVENEGNTIIACGRQVSGKKSARPLQTGNVYSLPPPPSGVLPRESETFEQWSTRLCDLGPEVSCVNAMVRSYQGVGPALARSIVEPVSSVKGTESFSDLDSAFQQEVFQRWRKWCQFLEQPGKVASPILTDTGYSLLGPVPIPDEQVGPSTRFISRYYGALRDEEEFSRIGQATETQIANLLSKAENRVNYFEEKMTDSSGAERLRERGDEILSFAHTWSEDSPFVVHEELSTGMQCRIPIPEGVTAVDYATSLHKKSQKLKRSTEKVQELLTASRGEVTVLQQALLALSDLRVGDRNLAVLKEIQSEVADLKEREKLGARPGQVGKPRSKATRQDPRKAAKAARRKNQGGGREADTGTDLLRIPVPGNENATVLVGRNNLQNDRLTFTIASSKKDWWLHAAGVAGAHVLLRGNVESDEGNIELSSELQFAADVAAHCSRARDSTEVPVNFVRPKNVSRAGPPGMVTFRNEKTLFGRPERAEDAVKNARLNTVDQ